MHCMYEIPIKKETAVLQLFFFLCLIDLLSKLSQPILDGPGVGEEEIQQSSWSVSLDGL